MIENFETIIFKKLFLKTGKFMIMDPSLLGQGVFFYLILELIPKAFNFY